MLPANLARHIKYQTLRVCNIQCLRKCVNFNRFRPISTTTKKVYPIPNPFFTSSKHASTLPKSDEKDLNHCNVGTIGHIDHGKTTLTAAITKVLEKDGLSEYISYDNIDKTKEERLRGITINATHVGYKTKKRHYAHTDCPGHRDFIRNMIAGTSQMDCAIVVVAATDGQMPQTVEHLLLTKQCGIDKLVVFINKADQVDSEVLELVEIEIRELLQDFGFDSNGTPVIVGSALLALKGDTTEYGEPAIRKLLDTIDDYVPTPTRDLKSPFLMAIDNFFTIPGRGSVVVGTIKRGIVKKNDEASLMGFGRTLNTSLSDIQIFKKTVPMAEAGDNIGVLIRNIKLKDIQRGMILCARNSEKLSNRFEAEFYLLSKSEGGRSKPIKPRGYIQQLFSATWDIACRVDLKNLDSDLLMPGEHATVHLTLLQGMIVPIGQQFTFRENNVTIGTGRITSILPSVIIPHNNNLMNIQL